MSSFPTLHIQFAGQGDGSVTIRKWSQFPFEGSEEYRAVPAPSPHLVGMPAKPPYEALRAVAWMKVDPASRRFEDTKGEKEVIGFERAEEIYANIRAALTTEERS